VKPVARGDSPPPGIIDTLSAGFQAVNRVPWVIGLPVLLDLLVWLGPRLSVAQLSDRVLGALGSMVDAMSRSAGASSAEQLSQFQQSIEFIRSTAQVFNLLSLLAVGGLSMRSAVPEDKSGQAGSFEIATVGAVLGIAIVLILVGVALAVIWLGLIAQQVREGRIDPPRLLRMAPRYWLAIVGFFALLIGALVVILVPISVVAAIAQIVAPAVGTFLYVFAAIAFQLLLFWCLLYLFFIDYAIVVSEVGPVRAALNSIRVVSTNFWSTLGFIIITWVIMAGMGVIWNSLSRAPVGIVVAILGNGYIESGLAAASMLFYRNRIARLAEPRRST